MCDDRNFYFFFSHPDSCNTWRATRRLAFDVKQLLFLRGTKSLIDQVEDDVMKFTNLISASSGVRLCEELFAFHWTQSSCPSGWWNEHNTHDHILWGILHRDHVWIMKLGWKIDANQSLLWSPHTFYMSLSFDFVSPSFHFTLFLIKSEMQPPVLAIIPVNRLAACRVTCPSLCYLNTREDCS